MSPEYLSREEAEKAWKEEWLNADTPEMPSTGNMGKAITDIEDAITHRFYLQLRINKLLKDEASIEKLLKHTLALVKKLNALG